MYHVSIKGTGHYVPNQRITNDDLAEHVDTNDEWIRTRTGIKTRYITKEENTSKLAYEAARQAIKEAGVEPEQLDLIICATVTPDSFTPSTACIVQNLLGAKHAAAFDVNAACTGLIYGISIATQFIENGFYENALIMGAETVSKLVDWSDRSTCVLFGDGAGAVYIERNTNNRLFDLVLAADGSKGNFLKCTAMPIKQIFEEPDQANERVFPTVEMQGGEVFKFAVKTIVNSVKTVLKRNEIQIQDIDWIIPHQANYRIIESAAKLLAADKEKFYINLDQYGNTSSASIGIALDELNKSGQLKRGQKVILVGFGGGMTSGAILMEW